MAKQWIESNPTVMMGKPVIVGTRITVELILEKLAAGETVEQLLDAHPRLTREGIQAALAVRCQRVARRCGLSLCRGDGMKFLADESVDRQIVERLRADGHVVQSVAEMEPGISDDVVLDRANRESSLLLTADKDFGEMVYRQRRLSSGVLLVRLSGVAPVKKAELVSAAVAEHGREMVQAFAVVDPGRVRIRRPFAKQAAEALSRLTRN